LEANGHNINGIDKGRKLVALNTYCAIGLVVESDGRISGFWWFWFKCQMDGNMDEVYVSGLILGSAARPYMLGLVVRAQAGGACPPFRGRNLSSSLGSSDEDLEEEWREAPWRQRGGGKKGRDKKKEKTRSKKKRWDEMRCEKKKKKWNETWKKKLAIKRITKPSATSSWH
jgi:hypothetical protein